MNYLAGFKKLFPMPMKKGFYYQRLNLERRKFNMSEKSILSKVEIKVGTSH